MQLVDQGCLLVHALSGLHFHQGQGHDVVGVDVRLRHVFEEVVVVEEQHLSGQRDGSVTVEHEPLSLHEIFHSFFKLNLLAVSSKHELVS